MSEITDYGMNFQSIIAGISMAIDQKFAASYKLTPADKIAMESVESDLRALVDKVANIGATAVPPAK